MFWHLNRLCHTCGNIWLTQDNYLVHMRVLGGQVVGGMARGVAQHGIRAQQITQRVT